jgi:hypothetical protein
MANGKVLGSERERTVEKVKRSREMLHWSGRRMRAEVTLQGAVSGGGGCVLLVLLHLVLLQLSLFSRTHDSRSTSPHARDTSDHW